MSLQSDLITVLAGVASGRVFPQIAPEKSAYPLVNYRILATDPIVTIHGELVATDYDVVFECWGSTYASAMSTAAAVRAAITASALKYSHIGRPADEYEPEVDAFMEPVYFRFTH